MNVSLSNLSIPIAFWSGKPSHEITCFAIGKQEPKDTMIPYGITGSISGEICIWRYDQTISSLMPFALVLGRNNISISSLCTFTFRYTPMFIAGFIDGVISVHYSNSGDCIAANLAIPDAFIPYQVFVLHQHHSDPYFFAVCVCYKSNDNKPFVLKDVRSSNHSTMVFLLKITLLGKNRGSVAIQGQTLLSAGKGGEFVVASEMLTCFANDDDKFSGCHLLTLTSAGRLYATNLSVFSKTVLYDFSEQGKDVCSFALSPSGSFLLAISPSCYVVYGILYANVLSELTGLPSHKVPMGLQEVLAPPSWFDV